MWVRNVDLSIPPEDCSEVIRHWYSHFVQDHCTYSFRYTSQRRCLSELVGCDRPGWQTQSCRRGSRPCMETVHRLARQRMDWLQAYSLCKGNRANCSLTEVISSELETVVSRRTHSLCLGEQIPPHLANRNTEIVSQRVFPFSGDCRITSLVSVSWPVDCDSDWSEKRINRRIWIMNGLMHI